MTVISRIKRPFERVYTEQWMIILVFLAIMVLGIDWGLPDKKRMDLLVGDSPPTERELNLLTSLRKEFLENLSSKADESIKKKDIKYFKDFWLKRALGAQFTEEDRLIAFRAYILGSSGGDERKIYASLSRMKPRQLDFDPKRYIYGGAYIYPVGGLLYALKLVGLFHVTNDFGYYLKHPANIANMYITGRSLNVLAFVGTLILLAIFGNMLDGRVAGTMAMLTYAFSTIFLVNCLLSVPHVYAAFWSFLGIYLLFLYTKERRLRFLICSVLSCGWAAGSIIPAVFMAVSYPIMLFDRRRLKESIIEILLSCAGVGVIFLLTNPYFIFSFDKYILSVEILRSRGHAVFSLSRGMANFREAFLASFTFPVAIFGFLYMFVACLNKDKNIRRMSLFFLCIFLPLLFFGYHTKTPLFLGPILCLFSGIAINKWLFQFCRGNRGLQVALICVVFLPGVFFTTLFARDYIFDKKWYEPTAKWIRSEKIGEGVTIGVFRRPTPNDTPAYPFLHTEMINMYKAPKKGLVPDYVIIGSRGLVHREKWEEHPLRSRYRLAHDLGDRPSYRWLLSLRNISVSRLSGWVYKRINVD